MEVNVKIYKTPRPIDWEGVELKHARVESKGTRRMADICERLLHLGLNSAQIKAILDGLAKFVGESLTEGYHIELDGIGTFSLSVKTLQETDESGEKKIFIIPDGANFKCSQPLRKKINTTKLVIQKEKSVKPFTDDERKEKLMAYLEKYRSINQRQYAKLTGLSLYQVRKELQVYQQEGLLSLVGRNTHKTYVLAEQ